MKTSIHQPSYFPWLGLLDKINKSDNFIILDNVQLADRAYQHRNIFLNNEGKEHLLTLNINKKGYRDKYIKDITLSDNSWQNKHNKFLLHNYKKHFYFDDIYPQIQHLFENNYTYLIDVLTDSMKILFDIYQIDTDINFASQIYTNNNIYKEDFIIHLLEESSADTYLSGSGAKSYQKEETFRNKNITLEYQNFKHPQYTQNKQEHFTYGLSGLDVAFNLGNEKTHNILKATR